MSFAAEPHGGAARAAATSAYAATPQAADEAQCIFCRFSNISCRRRRFMRMRCLPSAVLPR